MAEVSINSDLGEWGSSSDSGERARLLQSPCVDTAPKSEGEASPEGPGRGTTSTIGAIFIVVNACLGAGLLNFPAAFSTAGGLAAGVTLQMGMLVFIISGLVILGYCSQASNERTYQEVVWAVCGKLTGVLCEVTIAIYTFGTCIAFLIIIGDQQDKIIAVMAKEPEGAGGSLWYTDRKFTISLTAFLFILPLSIPREIGFQKYASFLSVVGTWYVTAIIIIKYIWPDKEMTPGDILTRPASWVAVFNAMPTICFGFQHAAAQGEDLGWGGDSRHGHRPRCLHGHRHLWLPDLRSCRGPRRASVLPFRGHGCGRCPCLHHPECAHLLPHPALLWTGCASFKPNSLRWKKSSRPAGGRWSVMVSSWSPWEPSSLARPQPTPSLWISWHNHCLPGNTWPLPLDPGTHLFELWGHPESNIIRLSCWDDIWTSFSRDSSGVKAGLTPLDSSNPAVRGLGEEVSCHRRTFPVLQRSTSPCLKNMGEEGQNISEKKNPA
ncbi:putative sodium-coupled neutral amino acid transporter 7 isoform X2 [Zalophus californianus]|uniref:Sodium-coupled neutral amino acid transporter 7 n=1 Tax=Zalophus californianus TaxID=9704 RepID=A0A6J2F3G6_ZALCA|nr:putative sodium-coupled neutral amino acid transporter 7 isoform X2 [Zalophus californianus]